MPKADLVLEGAGVKGLGTAGAVIRLLEAGYTFQRVAGTSVGALVAAFVSAGVEAEGLRRLMNRLDLPSVPDRFPPGLPVASEGLSLLTHSGAYAGDYIREWIYQELRKLDITTFGDLRRNETGDDRNLPDEHRYRLVVMATDVTHGRLLRLPWDYHLFNLDADDQLVADAVRMSLSIPWYFEPCTLKDQVTGEISTIVDGGVLSNLAIEIFDRTDDKPRRWDTFGVGLSPDLPAGIGDVVPFLGLPLPPPFELLKKVVATALVGHDQTHLERPGIRENTMIIDTSGVSIAEFGINEEKQGMLFRRGRDTADEFLTKKV